ncbi:MAG TPA: hypothetical protein VH592_02785 [Gemmataceae bacterium]|jgi:hypothetical protein
MSEPLAERLSRFTPDATGLDRDALLFAAGRASVRPSRRWKALAGALVVSQLLTLVCLWPRIPPQQSPYSPIVQPHDPIIPPDESVPGSLSEGALRAGTLSMDFDRPEPIGDERMVPPSPPLRAYGPPPASILN